MPADPQVASASKKPPEESGDAEEEKLVVARQAVLEAYQSTSSDLGRFQDKILVDQHQIVNRLERIAAAITQDVPSSSSQAPSLSDMISHFTTGLHALQASAQVQRYIAVEHASSIFSLAGKHRPLEVKATRTKHGKKERKEVESSAKTDRSSTRVANSKHHAADEVADTPIAVNRAKRKAASAAASTSSTPVVEKSQQKQNSAKKENGAVKKRTSNRLSKTSRTPAREEDEQTYCFCSRVSFGDMIGCDNEKCEIEWFHFECIGLTTKPKGRWFCPNCRHPDTPKMPKTGKGKKDKD